MVLGGKSGNLWAPRAQHSSAPHRVELFGFHPRMSPLESHLGHAGSCGGRAPTLTGGDFRALPDVSRLPELLPLPPLSSLSLCKPFQLENNRTQRS